MKTLRLGKRIRVGHVEIVPVERINIATFVGRFVQLDWVPVGIIVYEEKRCRALDLNGDALPGYIWQDLVNDEIA